MTIEPGIKIAAQMSPEPTEEDLQFACQMGVGYAVLWWVLDQAELANLAVRTDRQGQGIGSVLLDQAIEHVKSKGVESLFLEVRQSNESAYRLYANQGSKMLQNQN